MRRLPCIPCERGGGSPCSMHPPSLSMCSFRTEVKDTRAFHQLHRFVQWLGQTVGWRLRPAPRATTVQHHGPTTVHRSINTRRSVHQYTRVEATQTRPPSGEMRYCDGGVWASASASSDRQGYTRAIWAGSRQCCTRSSQRSRLGNVH